MIGSRNSGTSVFWKLPPPLWFPPKQKARTPSQKHLCLRASCSPSVNRDYYENNRASVYRLPSLSVTLFPPPTRGRSRHLPVAQPSPGLANCRFQNPNGCSRRDDKRFVGDRRLRVHTGLTAPTRLGSSRLVSACRGRFVDSSELPGECLYVSSGCLCRVCPHEEDRGGRSTQSTRVKSSVTRARPALAEVEVRIGIEMYCKKQKCTFVEK